MAEKTAGIDMIRRNYITVNASINRSLIRDPNFRGLSVLPLIFARLTHEPTYREP